MLWCWVPVSPTLGGGSFNPICPNLVLCTVHANLIPVLFGAENGSPDGRPNHALSLHPFAVAFPIPNTYACGKPAHRCPWKPFADDLKVRLRTLQWGFCYMNQAFGRFRLLGSNPPFFGSFLPLGSSDGARLSPLFCDLRGLPFGIMFARFSLDLSVNFGRLGSGFGTLFGSS